MIRSIAILMFLVFISCNTNKEKEVTSNIERIAPVVITDSLPNDSDDPAIWVHPTDPSQTLILGTDKEENGGIYFFDLNGKIVGDKIPARRPNNIDVEYNFNYLDTTTDIAVYTERLEKKIRVISLPERRLIDGGGISVFDGEEGEGFDAPMGIALYRSPEDEIHAIVSRKNGPSDGSYLWQYKLYAERDTVKGKLIRKFGAFSGDGEIEAIAVDDKRGFIYYSDEAYGIRKYHSDPNQGNTEITSFGLSEFTEDREGIALSEGGLGSYVVVSDQQEHAFEFFDLETKPDGAHKRIGQSYLSTVETDGCEIYADSLSPVFPKGIFVAMSEGKVFHYYRLDEILP